MWCKGLVVCVVCVCVCVGVCACVCVCVCGERQTGSSRAIGGRALAAQADPTTSSRIPAKVRSVVGGGGEAASSPIAGQLLMRLPAAGSVQCQAGLWRAREKKREEEGREKGRVESRTDDVNLARCPRATKSQCVPLESRSRVHCRAHAVVRCGASVPARERLHGARIAESGT